MELVICCLTLLATFVTSVPVAIEEKDGNITIVRPVQKVSRVEYSMLLEKNLARAVEQGHTSEEDRQNEINNDQKFYTERKIKNDWSLRGKRNPQVKIDNNYKGFDRNITAPVNVYGISNENGEASIGLQIDENQYIVEESSQKEETPDKDTRQQSFNETEPSISLKQMVEILSTIGEMKNGENWTDSIEFVGDNEIENIQEGGNAGGGGGGVAAILAMVLGPLSRPDGTVDLQKFSALLGSLSTPTANGTFDFTGLRQTISNLLGSDTEGNGGSDVGAFLGGVLTALVQGSAGKKGAEGAGNIIGNIAAASVPGIVPDKPSSGRFLAGLIPGILGASSASSSGGKDSTSSGGWGFLSKLLQIKMAVVRSILSIVTGLLKSSSK